MQKTDITPFLSPDLVQDNWRFAEVWIEPMLSPPYILLLSTEESGSCRIFDSAKSYAVIFTSSTYDEAQHWLLENECEPLEGQLSAAELR